MPPVFLDSAYQDWMSLRTNLLWIYEGEVPFDGAGGANYPWYFSAWLILKGEGAVTVGKKTVTARAGQWLIPWPGEREQFFAKGTRILSVRFQAHWPDGRALFEKGLGLSFSAKEFPEMEKQARRLLAVAEPFIPKKDPTLLLQGKISLKAFLAIKGAMLPFIGCFASVLIAKGFKPTRLGVRDERILAALQRLDFWPLNEGWKDQNLAREVGLGASQFVRLFRAELGTTPKKYLEGRRREACREMLLTSEMPFKKIASELGFAHASDFSAWFKRNFRMTPTALRKRAAPGD